ncbi:MAG: hypothetical protein ACOYXS_03575 [Chloroflexota bacterium]
MFATLLGPYPHAAPPGDPTQGAAAGSTDADTGAALRAAIAEQEAAGLEPLTDGHLRWADPVSGLAAGLEGVALEGPVPYLGTSRTVRRPRLTGEPRWAGPITVDAWRLAAGCTTRAVKQTIVGPYTLAFLADAGDLGRERATLALAEALREELRALAAAGCPLIQVDEDAATRIGDDPSERRLFVEAQRRLIDGIEGVHLSLAITTGNADPAGAATIFDPPYRSHLFDLIGGPDNWRLIAQAPGERGIICAALDPAAPSAGQLELLVWAARYAASTGRRGLRRVGLAPAPGLERLSPDAARLRIELLGRAARLATASRDELARNLDPRALDAPWRRRGPARWRPFD